MALLKGSARIAAVELCNEYAGFRIGKQIADLLRQTQVGEYGGTMAVVSISRGSNSRGREVAELVAQKLDCVCLAREDVIRDAGLTHVSDEDVVRALEEPPSFLEQVLAGRDRYMAAARAALLSRLTDEQIVFHGFAGHFFLKEIRHALKVRILADLPDRVSLLVKRHGLTESEAHDRLVRRDTARRQWALKVYGVDPDDPSMYDIVLHVGKLGCDDVSEIVCSLAKDASFAATEASRAELERQALSASVEALLIDMEVALETLDIVVHEGNVTVRLNERRRIRGGSNSEFHAHYVDSLRHRIHERARSIRGLKAVHLEDATQ